MHILVLNGSPRGERSNTHKITREFLKGAEEAGATSETVFLIREKIGFCRGCFCCWTQTPGVCIITDAMAGLLEKMRAADVIVFATPLYVDNVSGLMKVFMDRMIPFADPHFDKDAGGECCHVFRGTTPGKKMVAISNSGFPEQSHFQVLRLLFRRIARNTGFDLAGEIYRGGGELFADEGLLVSALLRGYKRLLRKAGGELVNDGRISEKTEAGLERSVVTDHQYIRGANRHWDKLIKESAARKAQEVSNSEG